MLRLPSSTTYDELVAECCTALAHQEITITIDMDSGARHRQLLQLTSSGSSFLLLLSSDH